MQSNNTKEKERNAQNSEVSQVESAEKQPEKQTFGLKIFSDTLDMVNLLYKEDNCSSRSQFIEKAIRFYVGYLLGNQNTVTEYIAPQLATITDGIVKGSELRLSRALFKIAVELGAVTHMMAAVHEVDDETLHKLRIMCTDEVKRINGIINFEKAVRYQRSDE